MSLKINPIVPSISVPGIRLFSNKADEYADGVNFTIGQPDFPTPGEVKLAGIQAIEQNLTGYSHNAGMLELRQSVSQFFHNKYNFYYAPENEIVITNGASGAIDSILRTILSPGDEVILPIPSYSGYESIIKLSGGNLVTFDTTYNDFIPNPEELEKLITPKTKAVIFNFPSNPTGVSLTKEQIEALVNVLKDKDLFILSDEIYSENVFDMKHTSFAQFEEIRHQLFLIHGLSKSHSMTGWRIGYALGDKSLVSEVLKVHLNNSICASSPSQYAAIEALTNCPNAPLEMNQAYIERRDYVVKRLNDMGLKTIKPQGAFYVFPSIQSLSIPSWDFALELLEQEHLAVVPGSAFIAEGYIRISYANSLDYLKIGLDRLENFIKDKF